MRYVDIMQVYKGSDGNATSTMYGRIALRFGDRGQVAINLFRACKTSERAKRYSRRYKGAAYDTKNWSLAQVCKHLATHGQALGIGWGWAVDVAAAERDDPFRHVLYVDIPTGQVSFHSRERGDGPDYRRDWDGQRGLAPERICRWVAKLFEEEKTNAET